MDDAPEEEVSEERELTPDEIFQFRVTSLLSTFSLRQTEILRLVSFMDERAAEIDNAAARARELVEDQLDDDLDEAGLERLITLLGDEINSDETDGLTGEERHEAFVQALTEVGDALPEGHYSTYVDNVLRALQAPPSGNFLRSSLLVTLVGELEMVVNQLARTAVERVPQTIEESGRTFTWAEISAHESIADLRDSLVDRAIEDVFRGSLTDWMDFFVKKFKIDPIAIAGTFEAQEAVQRRHCVVHNAGTISQMYLNKLESFKPKGEIGDSLDVDSSYIRDAADTMFLVVFSLVWSLSMKLCRNEEDRDDVFGALCNRTYFMLQERRYDLLTRLGQAAPLEKLPDRLGLVMKVNVWLAHKQRGTFDSVRDEVVAFDTSARSRDFQLAKYALLDEFEDASRVAESMLRDEELSRAHYLTWPLLAGVREHKRKTQEASSVADDSDDALVSVSDAGQEGLAMSTPDL
ncbi:hypothetical protein ASD43_16520 [Microbacterium sp. Root553]|nr:hypothetical protein ASD43_16520 [Microbacterium sp. Root553]